MTIHMTAHLLNPAGAFLLGVATWRVAATVWDSTAWLIDQARHLARNARTATPAKHGEAVA